MTEQVSVTREIAAPAEQVWAMVSDVTRMGESSPDERAGFFKPLAHLATGVGDRATHNRAGMEQTLDRLAAVAESSGRP